MTLSPLGAASLGAAPLQAADPAAGKAPPVRLGVLFMPNGVHQNLWTPEGEGDEFKLSSTLASLEDLKDELLVLTNLWNAASRGGDGHYVKTSGFLTCSTIRKTLGYDLNSNGTSMDQVAANLSGKETPLPSLELGVVPVSTGVDTNVGYTRVYGSHISWKSPTRPLAKEIQPNLVFSRLFRAGTVKPSGARKQKRLLDRVLEDANRLHKKLGKNDRRRLDEYLQAVRSIEERLERTTQAIRDPWKPRAEFVPGSKPSEGRPASHAERVRLMLDMIALAFQTDVTRVSTFMFGNSVSNENFSFLDGVKGGHHSISHHENKKDKLRQYAAINRWHVEQYGYLLRKLQSMKEGDGTVLDNSMILFGSGLRDGNGHNPHNLPIVVGGRASGRLATGRHIVYSKDTPLANLYVSLLDAFGAPVPRFADSTGPLRGVRSRTA
ncbi:MAG: DUF1552 domain-containing protein [Planctomycetota bacterium]